MHAPFGFALPRNPHRPDDHPMNEVLRRADANSTDYLLASGGNSGQTHRAVPQALAVPAGSPAASSAMLPPGVAPFGAPRGLPSGMAAAGPPMPAGVPQSLVAAAAARVGGAALQVPPTPPPGAMGLLLAAQRNPRLLALLKGAAGRRR